jgi:hypothetical protein
MFLLENVMCAGTDLASSTSTTLVASTLRRNRQHGDREE